MLEAEVCTLLQFKPNMINLIQDLSVSDNAALAGKWQLCVPLTSNVIWLFLLDLFLIVSQAEATSRVPSVPERISPCIAQSILYFFPSVWTTSVCNENLLPCVDNSVFRSFVLFMCFSFSAQILSLYLNVTVP